MSAIARVPAPRWRRILAWLKQPLGPSARCPDCKNILRGLDMAYSREGWCWNDGCGNSMWAKQRRSFAYGNVKLSNDAITRELVDEVDKS